MLHTCKGHGDTVVAVAVSHDDQFVASASVDRSMMVSLLHCDCSVRFV